MLDRWVACLLVRPGCFAQGHALAEALPPTHCGVCATGLWHYSFVQLYDIIVSRKTRAEASSADSSKTFSAVGTSTFKWMRSGENVVVSPSAGLPLLITQLGR